MPKNKNTNNQPLTLNTLADYNQKVLIPALEECFVTKKEFNEFKDDSLAKQDDILKKLDTLLTEKELRNYQKEKERKMTLNDFPKQIAANIKEYEILRMQN